MRAATRASGHRGASRSVQSSRAEDLLLVRRRPQTREEIRQIRLLNRMQVSKVHSVNCKQTVRISIKNNLVIEPKALHYKIE